MVERARVLIAEDSPTQAAHLRFLLEECNFGVRHARNGREGYELAQEATPDIIISDVVMPEMDGYAFCRAVKAHPVLRDVPVVLVTELSSPHDVFKGLDAGADNFLVKPYQTDHLLSRIDYLLANRRVRKSDNLQVGIEIELGGQRHFITAERQQILDLLISTYDQAVHLYDELAVKQRDLAHSYEMLNAIYGFADGLSRCYTQNDVVETVQAWCLRLPGVAGMEMQLWSQSELQPVASFGMDGVTLDPLDENGHVAKVPLVAYEREIGVLHVLGDRDGAFTDEELRMLAGIGNQIVIAIERARLNADLEAQVQQRTEGLRQANETLEAILDASPVAILTLDRDSRILSWNRGAEAILGFSREEMIEFVAPLDGREFRDHSQYFARVIAGESIKGVESTRVRKDGTAVDVRISGSPLYDASGEIRGAVFTFEDITARKRADLQLRQAQKMEALGSLTGGIAHDFNNLLTIVIGNLDLLELTLDDNTQALEKLEDARHASLRGADLTRQLLTFARSQALSASTIDLNTLLRGSVKLLARTIGENIEIVFTERPDVWPVHADAAQLESAIVNLAVNARDAMPDGGRLTIGIENVRVDESFAQLHPALKQGKYVSIDIGDTGTGIAPDTLERIFEPFFTTKADGKGTGLGLAMVYGFTSQSKGHITVYSELGAGTTFRMYLPRSEHTEDEEVEAKPTYSQLAGNERVLVVEDNNAIRTMVEQQLSAFGYSVSSVSSADAALSVLERDPRVALVFSDVMMPGRLNGISLASTISERWPSIRILLTSGFTAPALHQHGSEEFAILSKPYRTTDLAERVRQVLDS